MDLEEQCDIDTIIRDDILTVFEQLIEPLKGGDDLLEIDDEPREF